MAVKKKTKNWHILGIKFLLKCWLPYLLRKPQKIKYLFRWYKSLRTGKNRAVEDECPLMSYEAIDWLNDYLKPEMRVFEWGSGGSTLWIRKRAKIISIEHDEGWAEKTGAILIKDDEKYVGAIDEYPDNYFDLVIVDGVDWSRKRCMPKAFDKVKKGGYLLLDDILFNYKYKGSKEEVFEEIEKQLKNGWGKRKEFRSPQPYALENPEIPRKTNIWQKLGITPKITIKKA